MDELEKELSKLNEKQLANISKAVLPTLIKRLNEFVIAGECTKEEAFDNIVSFSAGLENE